MKDKKINMERISKQQLQKMYSVDRATIENWFKYEGLPYIEISTHSKYVRLDDLIAWENSKMKNNL